MLESTRAAGESGAAPAISAHGGDPPCASAMNAPTAGHETLVRFMRLCNSRPFRCGDASVDPTGTASQTVSYVQYPLTAKRRTFPHVHAHRTGANVI